MKKLFMLPILALAFAGCGGSGQHKFSDQKVFQAYVAGYLGVSSVSCTKTGATSAECKTPSGANILVLCESADAQGGHSCTISRRS